MEAGQQGGRGWQQQAGVAAGAAAAAAAREQAHDRTTGISAPLHAGLHSTALASSGSPPLCTLGVAAAPGGTRSEQSAAISCNRRNRRSHSAPGDRGAPGRRQGCSGPLHVAKPCCCPVATCLHQLSSLGGAMHFKSGDADGARGASTRAGGGREALIPAAQGRSPPPGGLSALSQAAWRRRGRPGGPRRRHSGAICARGLGGKLVAG